ncbi:DUF4843 domain-containing protein [Butyricimonas sp.]|uniref:DUF4843 domain-containing protein n=1 Tax=Butyricimonas sp. TaxID=1969738 RepID=UPI0025B99109|nr:DUF4843 domain-containing protein [Butyricimonas sp.]
MKNRLYMIWSIILLMIFASCEKDPWVWDTSRKTGIVLDGNVVEIQFSEYTDTIWAAGGASYSILGVPVDYDREILVEVIDSLTNMPSTDYKIEAVLTAGAVRGAIRVWARRPAYKEYEDMKLWVGLRILENDEFIPMMQSPEVTFGVKVVHPQQPKWWVEDLLGKFSEVAYRKLFEIYNELWYKWPRPEEYRAMLDLFGYRLQMLTNEGKWSGIYLAYQPLFKQGVLVPLFDYFTEHPNPEVEIPEWYNNK